MIFQKNLSKLTEIKKRLDNLWHWNWVLFNQRELSRIGLEELKLFVINLVILKLQKNY